MNRRTIHGIVGLSLAVASSQILLNLPGWAQKPPPPPPPPPPPKPIVVPVAPTMPAPPRTLITPNNLPKRNVNDLNPVDQNQGNTGVTMILKHLGQSQQVDSAGVAIPPMALFATGQAALNPRFEEQLPANLKVIDTDAADTNRSGLVPNAFVQGGNPGEPVMLKVGQSHRNLIVFPADGDKVDGILLGLPGTQVSGSQGTVVSGNKGVITLHVGDISVSGGRAPVKIATGLAGLKADPHAVVQFSYYPDDVFGIANLSAPGRMVNVRVAHDPSTVRALVAGDSISSTNGGVQVTAKHGASSDNALATNPADSAAPIRILAQQGTEFLPGKDSVRLVNGACFMDVPSGYRIETAMGTVFATKRVLLRVERLPGLFRVQCCSGPDAAYVISGHTKVPLERGEELLLTDHKPLQTDAVPADGIGRRNFSMQSPDNGLSAVLADFSIFSLLSTLDYIDPIKHPNNAVDRAIRDRLLQTSAAVDSSTPRRPQYFVQQAGKTQ